MQAPKEIPPDYHCKDKFLVQSIVAEEWTTLKDIVPDMVNSGTTRIYEVGMAPYIQCLLSTVKEYLCNIHVCGL